MARMAEWAKLSWEALQWEFGNSCSAVIALLAFDLDKFISDLAKGIIGKLFGLAFDLLQTQDIRCFVFRKRMT